MQAFRFRSIILSGKELSVDSANNFYVDGNLVGGLSASSGNLLWNRDDSLSGALDATGQYLLDQIVVSNNGVASINGLSGLVGITGLGDISVSTSVDTIYISGSFVSPEATGNFITQANLNESGLLLWNRDQNLSDNIAALSGSLSDYVLKSETGQFASDLDVSSLSSDLGSTGLALWARDQGLSNNIALLSGDLTSASGSLLLSINSLSAGQTTLNNLSGAVYLSGAGAIEVSENGQYIIVSGAQGGGGAGDVVSINGVTGLIELTGSGNIQVSVDGTVFSIGGDFVTPSQTGGFLDISDLSSIESNLASSGSLLWDRDENLSAGLVSLSGNINDTGEVLWVRDSNLSSNLAAISGLIGAGGAGNVVSINGVTGLIELTGSGNVLVQSDGTIFRIGGVFITPDDTGIFATKDEVNAASAGVASINSNSGILTFVGVDGVSISTDANTFYFSGSLSELSGLSSDLSLVSGNIETVASDLGSSGLTLWVRDQGLSENIALLSGQIVFINETGQFASDIDISNIDLRLHQSGETLYLRDENLSVNLALVSGNISTVSSSIGATGQTLWLRDLELSNNVASLSGNVVFTSQTGQFASDLDVSNLSVQFNNTGLSLFNRDLELSNNFAILSGQVVSIISETGSFYLNSNPSGFITGLIIGLPSDGSYGGSNGPIAGISQGDRSEDAFDKIEVILGKLAPSKPANLSAKTLAFESSTYSAKMQGSNVTYSNVTSDTTPSAIVTGFYDGDAGTLTAYVNGSQSGQIVLTTGNDSATNLALQIYNDNDFWSGVAGKEGFWRYLNSRITPTSAFSTGEFSFLLDHSDTGPTPTLSGLVDNPATPSVSNISTFTGAHTIKWLDGVPGFNTNSVVGAVFDVSNAVGAFYNSTRVGRIESSYTTDTDIAATGNPINGAILHPSGTVLVETNKYIENLILTCRGYSSNNATASNTASTNVRIDTLTNQQAQRVTASTGQYPVTGYGLVYDDTFSITHNEELQNINNAIKYPPSVNYSADIPVGPNYTSITAGSYDGYRWACFNMGTISADSSITVQFNNTSNFGATTILTDMLIYALVSGATPTNGWIDGNAAYPGVGNPTNNGDPALVVGSSDADTKVITFGTAPKDGSVYIRIGIKNTSNKQFRTISMS